MSKKCTAKKDNGERCGAWAVNGKTKCALHSDPELASKMGAKHGRMAALPADFNAPTTLEDPKTADQVRNVLAETITQVRRRRMDTRTANALAYVATSLLRAIEVGDIESRLKELEERRGKGSDGSI
jgi:hypothetical protein